MTSSARNLIVEYSEDPKIARKGCERDSSKYYFKKKERKMLQNLMFVKKNSAKREVLSIFRTNPRISRVFESTTLNTVMVSF